MVCAFRSLIFRLLKNVCLVPLVLMFHYRTYILIFSGRKSKWNLMFVTVGSPRYGKTTIPAAQRKFERLERKPPQRPKRTTQKAAYPAERSSKECMPPAQTADMTGLLSYACRFCPLELFHWKFSFAIVPSEFSLWNSPLEVSRVRVHVCFPFSYVHGYHMYQAGGFQSGGPSPLGELHDSWARRWGWRWGVLRHFAPEAGDGDPSGCGAWAGHDITIIAYYYYHHHFCYYYFIHYCYYYYY